MDRLEQLDIGRCRECTRRDALYNGLCRVCHVKAAVNRVFPEATVIEVDPVRIKE